MATYPVKWFCEAMRGAPLLSTDTGNGVPGTLISVLKACLVTGFNLNNIQSLAMSEGNLAVATFAMPHALSLDSIVLIEGAGPGWDGEHRLLSVTSTTATFAPAGTPATVTGKGTMKTAPAGWEMEFVNGDQTVAVFKRTAPAATPLRLRIDNSAFTGWNGTSSYRYYYAKAQIVEAVLDVDSFTLVKEYAWPASHAYATGEQQWDLVADGQMFYFFPRYSVKKQAAVLMFGDLDSVRPNDNYHCVLSGIMTPQPSVNYHWGAVSSLTSGWGPYNDVLQFGSKFAGGGSNTDGYRTRRTLLSVARMHHQLPGPDTCLLLGIGEAFGYAYQGGVSYPNGPDNGVYFNDGKTPVVERSANAIRGFLPGVLAPLQNDARGFRYNFAHNPAKPEAMLRLLKGASSSDLSTYNGDVSESNSAGYFDTSYRHTERMIGVDITGPWR